MTALTASISLILLGAPSSPRTDIKIRHVFDTGSGGDAFRLARNPADGFIYYLKQTGSLYRLTLSDGANSTAALIYMSSVTGVKKPMGIAFGPEGNLYISGNEAQGLYTVATIRRGILNAAGSDTRTWSNVARTEPYPLSAVFNHLVNGIAVSPDGSFLFVNSGARTDHGEITDNNGAFPGLREVPLTTVMFKLPSAATDIVLPNDAAALDRAGYVFARGLRNSYDPAFAPNGDLFAGENSGDRDDNEELNWIQEGRHYGFPWRMGTTDTPQRFPGYDGEADLLVNHAYTVYKKGLFKNDPTYPPPPADLTDPIENLGPDADSFRDPATGEVKHATALGMTLGTFTAHRSPLGLVFDAARAMSAEFQGDGFILGYTPGASSDGVEGPFKDPGQDMLHLKLEKTADRYQVRTTRIVQGFNHPVDAEITGNKIYVLDNGGSGSIWEVTLPPAGAASMFVRGSVNVDASVDISDAVAILLYLFAGRSIGCVEAADVNDDGQVDTSDPIDLLKFLFAAGPAPPEPTAGCGVDPTADSGGALGCQSAPGC